MPLQKQVIEIPLGQGIESKAVKYTVPVDRLKRCHNGRWVESNRIEKRPPYVSIGRMLYSAANATVGTMTSAVQLGECNGQALAVNSETYHSRLCACVDAVAGTWRQSNRLPNGYCTRAPVYRAGYTRPDSQSARAGGLVATVFSGVDYNLRAVVHDESTGEVAVAEKALTDYAAATPFRVIALGTWIVVMYGSPVNGELWARCLNTADPSMGWTWQELLTGAHMLDTGNIAIDAQTVFGSTTDVLFAYNESAAELLVQKYRRDHVAGTWSTLATSVPIAETSPRATCVCQSGDGTHVLVAWIGSADKPRWMVLTSVLAADIAADNLTTDLVLDATIITAVAQPATGSSWAVLYDNGKGYYLPVHGTGDMVGVATPACITFVPIVGGAGGLPQYLYGYSLASTPVCSATEAWTTRFIAKHTDTLQAQCSYFLVRHLDVDWDGGGQWYLECVAAPRQAGTRTINMPSQLHAPTATTLACSLGIGYNAAHESGVDRFTFTLGEPYRFVPVGDATLILGSQPMVYDGAHCTGLGFPVWPEVTAVTSTIGGGMPPGTYYYRVCLAYHHADGRVERSAPSAALTVTHPAGTNTNQTLLTIINRPLDRHWATDVADIGTADKTSQAVYEVYRTTLTDSINYHLIGESAVMSNDQYDAGYTDMVADASIATKPYLYTTEAAGEPVANTCPGSARFGCVHRGRIWLAGTEDPFIVWFSKYLRAGEGFAFSDEFTLDLRDQGQPVTGLASLEDKLVIFTESQTFVVYGDGPADAGGETGFDPPLRISGQIGCTDDRSIVQCPAGVFFLSRTGISMIDRGLNVTAAGSPAFSVTRDYPTCLASLHAESEHQVRWLLRSAVNATILLCYDYLHGQWLTAAPVNATSSEVACYHAAAVGGVCHLVTTASLIGYEHSAAASFSDTIVAPGGYYSLVIETADIHLGAIQGYQRCWRAVLMLESLAPHTLTAQVFVDYSSVASNTKAWTVAELTTLGSEQVQINPTKQQTQALRFAFWDSAGGSGSGKGFAAIAIGLEYGVATGLKRLPTAARR